MVALHHTRLLLAATALAVSVPVAISLAQPAPAPAAGNAAPAAGNAAPTGRGGRGADRPIVARSDGDRALVNPYSVNTGWYTMPPGRFLGGASAIAIDKDGTSVWIAERCGGWDLCAGSHVNPVIRFNAAGKITAQIGADMISYPHGLDVDKDGNVWVTDLQSNTDNAARAGRGNFPNPPPGSVANPAGAQVLKFSPQGKLLLRIGTPGVYGKDQTHLSQPSDVVVSPVTGEVFVSDVHDTQPANNRIVVFDRNGKYLREWPCEAGTRGLDCSHGISMDSHGNIFSANRSMNRVDVFDPNGNLLHKWLQFGRATGVYVDKKDNLYVSDSGSGAGSGFLRGIHVGSAETGIVTAFIPDPWGQPSADNAMRGTSSPEGVTADKNGVIYASGVTPAGIARYTIQHNVPWSNSQGRGPGSPNGPPLGTPVPTVAPPAGP
jgi:sugar lactone lactonase YvrE